MDVEDQQEEQHKAPWLKKYQWKPGQSGNPGGRPKGPSLKVWLRNYFEDLNDEDRVDFLKNIHPSLAWQMAEGRPDTKSDVNANLTGLFTGVKKIVFEDADAASEEKQDAETSPEAPQ